MMHITQQQFTGMSMNLLSGFVSLRTSYALMTSIRSKWVNHTALLLLLNVAGKCLYIVEQHLKFSDHDFSKFSMVSSVTLFVDIPSDIWYHGQVHVTLKEGAFEPSSPIRHSAELANFISSQ